MKQAVDVVIVIPIGPGCKQFFIEDTINSLQFYFRSSYKIILADDSHNETGKRVQKNYPDAALLTTAAPMGKLCGLYITLSEAFSYALDHYTFKALLRIDTDSLVIGNAPEKAAIALFAANPGIGMVGQYPFTYDGNLWDRSWPGAQLYRMMHTFYFFRTPIAHLLLIRQYLRARKNNYQRGESVFGGACFFNPACLKVLREKGLLPSRPFKLLKLEEDHLFSLLVKAVGFQLAGLSGEGQPFGCAWLGLAAAPDELVENGKKIIHSTRFWKDMPEEHIRSWFRARRKMSALNSYLPSINN